MSETPLDEQTKSKKPSSSAFKQQRLPAWQPILTAGTVLPTFFIIGIAFIPIGIGLLISSNNVQEYIIDYTDCISGQNKETSCAKVLNNIPRVHCTCNIKFNLTEDYKGDVYMYYGLSNFYQNHRRYVKSRDDNQLLGNLNRKVSSDCEPFAYGNITYEAGGYPVAPCGAIANSLFNDTLTLSYEENENKITKVDLLNTGIAWPTDKQVKFRNPKGNISTAFEKYLKPQNWQKYVWELDPSADGSNNGFQNEDLIVWMRTAALPTFRKLYRRVDHSKSYFKSGLPKGVYYLNVEYNYPVSSFEGSKRMILSTTSWLGGKNPFLGIAYIVVGCVCLVLGFVFLVIHIKFGKSAHDMVNITQKTGF